MTQVCEVPEGTDATQTGIASEGLNELLERVREATRALIQG